MAFADAHCVKAWSRVNPGQAGAWIRSLHAFMLVVVGCLRTQKSMTLAHIATSTLVAKKPNS